MKMFEVKDMSCFGCRGDNDFCNKCDPEKVCPSIREEPSCYGKPSSSIFCSNALCRFATSCRQEWM